MARYIFITGGVVSSLGKGLASAALGALLQARGYKVRLRKLDPYLNLDPGTMSPYQHGEVFVTDDGAETDLDLGHYERFTGRPASKAGACSTSCNGRSSSRPRGRRCRNRGEQAKHRGPGDRPFGFWRIVMQIANAGARTDVRKAGEAIERSTGTSDMRTVHGS